MGRPVVDLREAARRRLPRLLFDYIDGGAYDEVSIRRNREDLANLALRQRTMTDISALSMRTELFGRTLSMPLALAPVGFSGMYARRGEVQAARAAHAAGVPFCLSTLSICGLEEVVRDSGAPIWFQFYMLRDRGFCASLLQRAQAAGCPVLLMTVDLPIAGARYRDLRSGMSGPDGWRGQWMRLWQGATHPRWLWDVWLHGRPHGFGNLPAEVAAGGVGGFAKWIKSNFDPTVTWRDIEWVRKYWNGPLVIKGLLDRADARAALDAGVDGIVVSNHGGRQLDGAPSSISVLPEIVETVGSQIEVMFDGGIRTGQDAVRALALGAKSCMIGRAYVYGLGAGGQAGVAKALDILAKEMETTMGLCGVNTIAEIDRHILRGDGRVNWG